MNVILQSKLTCPECGATKVETMPTDACQYFYECTTCKMLLKPKHGDCCVFCSYGSVPCPPIQEGNGDDCCRPDAHDEPSVEIRPGVRRPDWSVLVSLQSRQALAGRLAARTGLSERWAIRLEADADLVWRTILRLYVDLGRAPTRADIVAGGRVAVDDVANLLGSLRSHDLIDLDSTGEIKLAYPFTQASTGHWIHVGGRILNALCAIDALGAAAMYQRDIEISSSCQHCREPVHVAMAGQGTALKTVMPAGAVVWYDFAYDGSAASSCCSAITFFCSEEHRRLWLRAQMPQRKGIDLTMDEALQVGRAIFGPVLADAAPA